MSVILSFSDMECLNESAAGSLGAGMASFARADIPAVRGFVVTPLVFSDFLKKEEVAAALDLFRSGAETPDESWRTVKAVFACARLSWNNEMEILAAFGEIGFPVSVAATSLRGPGAPPVYATGSQDLLEAVKHCWLRWLRTGIGTLGQDIPAVAVREVVDSETSVEIARKGQEFRVRAVFGLPEGLHDPAISSDIFEFLPDGSLGRMETRPQDFQYVMKGGGPSRVGISADFREEEKLTGEMLSQLGGIMAFMRERPTVLSCSACFVSGRPLVCSAALMSESPAEPDMPARARSMSLMEPARQAPARAPLGPVIATRIFLKADSKTDLERAGDAYLDGILLSESFMAGNGPAAEIAFIASEAKRRFSASEIILAAGGTQPPELLARALDVITGEGMRPGILMPGMRSAEELASAVRFLLPETDKTAKPAVWTRVMYPSNLFFMEPLARGSDVLVLDLDSLARLMLGGGEGDDWLRHTVPALEQALEPTFGRKSGAFAVMSDDMVSMPSMLEFLVRRGTDIICVGAGELHTVKHIIASVEKRMLLERGRG